MLNLIALIFLSQPVPAEELAFRNNSKNYLLTYEAEGLSYRSATARFRIPAKKCNRAILADFWKDANTRARKYPRTLTQPKKGRASVRIGHEWRLITPMFRTGLSTLEAEVRMLEIRERKACARS